MPAINVTYNTLTGVLDVTGTGAAEHILVKTDSVGNIIVKENGVVVAATLTPQDLLTPFGKPAFFNQLRPTVNSVTQINIDAAGGDDTVTIDETNGLFLGAFNFFGLPPNAIAFGVDGGAGTDLLAIRGLNRQRDRIDLGQGGVNLDGDEVVDVTYGGIENFSLDGQGGHDRLRANGNAVVGAAMATPVNLFGAQGNDRLVGGDDDDTITGGLGDDTVTGGAGDDTMDGGAGTDVVREAADTDFTLTDTSLDGAGADDLTSIERAHLTGGDGDNVIDASGFSGPVSLFGLGGEDTLIGGDEDDTLDGGAGDDSLTGGAGDDTFRGGEGTDRIIETGNVNFTLTNTSLLGLGTDVLDSIERGTLTGGDSANTIITTAFTGDVQINAEGGDDTVTTGPGDDELNGGDDDDNLDAGAGDDTIDGGDGDDTCTAGETEVNCEA
jgi:Ca2+-binding RTX toxin-like protein